MDLGISETCLYNPMLYLNPCKVKWGILDPMQLVLLLFQIEHVCFLDIFP